MRRLRVMAVSAVSVLISVAACTAGVTPGPTRPTPRPTATSSASAAPPVVTASPEPTLPETPAGDPQLEEFPRSAFADPTSIDNEWFPLVPGTRFVYDGEVDDDEGRVPIRVTFTVTDLTKDVDGVRTVVVHIVDQTAGDLVEAEIAFFAQDDAGNVWLMGEHPEEYEENVFVDAPTWIAGLQGARAGIAMQADPDPRDPSYSQGWGPEVEFTDRARVFETGSQTCVPFACYEDVLVIDEFNPDEPDRHQLKYYARNVGEVRVGWAGALVEDHEVLELVRITRLGPADQAQVRRTTLALEAHAYEISPDVYGRTEAAEAGAAGG